MDAVRWRWHRLKEIDVGDKINYNYDADDDAVGHRQHRLMDQDEQDSLIQTLETQSRQQQTDLEQIYWYLCCFVTVISLSLVVLSVTYHQHSYNNKILSNHVSGMAWIHGIVASLCNLALGRPGILVSQQHYHRSLIVVPAILVFVVVPTVCLMYARRQENPDRFVMLHYSLWGCNVILLVGAVILHREWYLSEQALQDLKAARYRYKSL